MANAIRAQKLLEASETSSVDLLKKMKKLKGNRLSSDNLTDVVDGVTGENIIVEEGRTLLWRRGEYYCTQRIGNLSNFYTQTV